MSLAFLEVDPSAGNAVSPITVAAAAAGAHLELRGGWSVATTFGDPAAETRAVSETVGVADVSHLAKLELHGPFEGDLGVARLDGDTWWCPITRQRQLLIGASASVAEIRAREPEALDVTGSFGALVVAGPLARETFARFCALDLREQALPVQGFRPGSVARTPGFLLRESDDRFLVLFGAAYGEYLWEVVLDAATYLGGRAVGVDVLEGVMADA
jgi:glycine cleavage system aminomethyltransferase T